MKKIRKISSFPLYYPPPTLLRKLKVYQSIFLKKKKNQSSTIIVKDKKKYDLNFVCQFLKIKLTNFFQKSISKEYSHSI